MALKFLSFSFFDDKETQDLFHYLNPKANLPLRNELHSLTKTRYSEMEKIVLNILQNNSSKISYTLDGWTSISNRSYFGVTAHFIDNSWKMHSLTLFFIPSNGNHSGRDIAEAFSKAVTDSSMHDKIQGVTLDNAAANTTFVKETSKLIKFDATDQRFQCYGHILNLGAQDLLNVLKIDNSHCANNENDYDGPIEDEDDEESEIDADEKIENLLNSNNSKTEEKFPLLKLRKLFKLLKLSEQWRVKLKSCCDVTEDKMYLPNMDVSTRWNSTISMINTALKMKKSLNLLCELNDQLKDYLILKNEWLILMTVFKFLKYFNELTQVLSGDKYVTLSLVVIGFNLLLDKITAEIDYLRGKSDIEMNWVDDTMLKGLEACLCKLLKHYSKSNWVYCAVLILDPRFKVESFYKSSWGREMVRESLEKFESMYKMTYYKPKVKPYRLLYCFPFFKLSSLI